MINKTTIWQHIMQAMNAFASYYRQDELCALSQGQVSLNWLPLLRTAVVSPTLLTAGHLANAIPYDALNQRRELLESAREQGLLAEEKPGGYRLTQQGKELLDTFFNCAHAAIAGAPALPIVEMEELAALLERIVSATERLPLPRSKANFEGSRWADPGLLAPATVRVEQYLTDLLFFRQDAHLASWQAYGIDGRSWEAFTYIWRDQANTPADLARKLARRGYAEADYAAAIQQLLDKGWIERALGRWQITGSGRALRDVAEMVTDRLFFAGWRTLSEKELERLNELLVSLFQSLQQADLAPLPA